MSDVRGILICLEGIDGAGKTSLAERVSTHPSGCGQEPFFVDKKDVSFAMEANVAKQIDHLRNGLWFYEKDLDLDLLGDRYWLYTISAWYSTIKRIRIDQLLAAGVDVIVDGWTYKYLARFSLKSEETAALAKTIFDTVPHPDLTIRLQLTPEQAASRKNSFKKSESGAFDGESAGAVAGFISYQSKVSAELDKLAQEHCWVEYQCGEKGIPESASDIIKIITEYKNSFGY
ncbi:hypothetical protein [Pseudomonas syringae]|uniref:hypothetical protein n=1 Tax=Pseudomonas syringae TaxID=317 RepID=UPI000CDA7244|nr:hypothetical protein [Pseudomonas syringae]POP63757.1 hypothetical protein CXB35_27545 [Pseudomonas syringae]